MGLVTAASRIYAMVIRLGRAIYTVVHGSAAVALQGVAACELCRKRNKSAGLFPENAIIRSPEITGPNYRDRLQVIM
jgi:hypothetical protein